MSRRTYQDLSNKLFSLSTRPRKWHNEPQIILPQSIDPIDPEKLFRKNNHKKILELGAGWGEFAASYLEKFPDWDYTAFEIKPDRILNIIKKTNKIKGAHVKIIPINLNWFLTEILPKNTWDLIVINFPDPWPKKRHAKHRLIQPGFSNQIRTLLQTNANLWIATDHGPYARRILSEFRTSPYFESKFRDPDYRRTRPTDFFPTKFERIQMSQGKKPYYMNWIAR